MNSDKKCLNIQEVSKRIGLGHTRTQQYVRAGIIPSVKLGRRYLIPTDVLDKWLVDQANNNKK